MVTFSTYDGHVRNHLREISSGLCTPEVIQKLNWMFFFETWDTLCAL